MRIIGKLSLWTFITVLACYICQTSNGLRVLGLFPFHGKSHYLVGERLLKALAAKGHTVDVYSHYPQSKRLPNFTDYSLAGSMPKVQNNVTYDELLKHIEGTASMKYWMEFAGKKICELMRLPLFQELFRNPPRDPPYDVIISDLCFSICYAAWSYRLKIPIIDLGTAIPYDWTLAPHGNPINHAVDASFFTRSAPPLSFFERLMNFYTGTSMSLLFRYYVRDQNQIVEELFGPGYPRVEDMLEDVAMLLVNYHASVHGPRPFVPSIVPIGGMHIDHSNETSLSQGLQSWLDRSADGFVYFSFGSMVRTETFPLKVIQAFYHAFESLAPIRVLWKIAEPRDLPLPPPKNVRNEKWLPQAQVLKHKNIKAFVTHGGQLSGYEAIYYGVPLVSVPFFADQYLNADLYVKRSIGTKVNLQEITADTFTRALNEVTRNPVYKQNIAKLSEKFKDGPMSPVDTAVYWVEYVARHGRDALRSPIVDLPWWKASLLDVYCFVVGISVLIFYCLWKVLKLFRDKINRTKPKSKMN